MSKTRKRMCSYRPWGSTENGAIEFESLTDETLEGAINVLRKSFFIHESVCTGVDLTSEPGASEELEELCLITAKDGASVVAIDVQSNTVVSVCFNKIQVLTSGTEKSFFERFSENCKYKSSKALVDFMINVDSRMDLFKHYNVDCILELMFLATLPTYTKRRIGELIIASSLELGKELKRGKNVKIPVTIHGSNEITNVDKIPSLASAMMTSRYSIKIAATLGFEKQLAISFDKFEFNGKKFSEKVGKEHHECVLVAKRLTPI